MDKKRSKKRLYMGHPPRPYYLFQHRSPPPPLAQLPHSSSLRAHCNSGEIPVKRQLPCRCFQVGHLCGFAAGTQIRACAASPAIFPLVSSINRTQPHTQERRRFLTQVVNLAFTTSRARRAVGRRQNTPPSPPTQAAASRFTARDLRRWLSSRVHLSAFPRFDG